MAVQRRHRGQPAPVTSGSICAAPGHCCNVRQSRSPWRSVLRPGLANTAATVIATAQEPAAKRQQAATIAPVAVRHCRPGRLGRGGVVARHRRRAARQQIIRSPAAGNRDASLFLVAASLICHSNGDAVGTLSQLRPIPGHPGGMHPPTPQGSLPASARSVQRLAARLSGAIAAAVDLPAIAAAAHDDLAAAPHAHEQTARPRGVSARHRRRGVDEPRPPQDTRPACVLSGTVWGAAPGQNGQVQLGAVLNLKFWQASASLPRRSLSPVTPETAATPPTPHPLPIMPARGRAQILPPHSDGPGGHPATMISNG